MPLAGSWKLIVPSVVGGIVGAELAVDLDEQLLRQTIGVLLLVLLAVMLLNPERWIAAHVAPREPRLLVEVPLFFAIGVYGGFIQVSVGLFLLAGLVLGAGYNLIGANAMKNLIVLVFTAAALVVFVVNDQVEWTLGLAARRGTSRRARGSPRTSPSSAAPSSSAGSSSSSPWSRPRRLFAGIGL